MCCRCSSHYFPSTWSALSSKLNTLNTWMCPALTDISKVRQQGCCPASPFGTSALLHNPSCCPGTWAATFSQEWLVKEREWGSALEVTVQHKWKGCHQGEAEGTLYMKQCQALKGICFPGYSTGCQSTMLVYGWIELHFSHTTVTVLCNCFSPGFPHKPSFT